MRLSTSLVIDTEYNNNKHVRVTTNIHLENRRKFEQQSAVPRQLRKLETFPEKKKGSASKTKVLAAERDSGFRV